MAHVLVNIADWDGEPLPCGWVIVNAPRPIGGELAWHGHFRHGVFYAAAPPGTAARFQPGWDADDAWPVVFTTNEAIEAQVLAKFREYGYASAEEAGVTIAEQADCMGLPWHEDTR